MNGTTPPQSVYESSRESGIADSLPPRFDSGGAVVSKYCGYAMRCCGNKCPQTGQVVFFRNVPPP